MELNKIHCVDVMTGLKQLQDESCNCIVTSPPYWMLRNYGVQGQLGMESTPEQYIEKMVEVFGECHRVLRGDGVLWINIGDSYMGSGKAGNNPEYQYKHTEFGKISDEKTRFGTPTTKKHPLIKPKDQVGIPFMLALALRDWGWYFRDTVIWAKTSAMPESVSDRCTKAHEYVFMFSKSSRYYYDAYAIATPYKDKTLTTFGIESKPGTNYGDGTGLIQSENWAATVKTRKPKEWEGKGMYKDATVFASKNGGKRHPANDLNSKPNFKTPTGWDTEAGAHGNINRGGRSKPTKSEAAADIGTGENDIAKGIDGTKFRGHSGNYDSNGNLIGTGRANKRSVWTIGPQAFKDAHFATFPEELPYNCILAGCPEDGLVLDPFMGAGTVGLVARKLGRNFIGFEINPAYVDLANKRLDQELGLFK